MNNALVILEALDGRLNAAVELTLYGRAALALGFPDASADYAVSRDVDAVLWIGQAEDLCARTNFWEAVESVNHDLAERDLYVSHFFTEEQVALRPDWRDHRVPLEGSWKRLRLYRLGNTDFLLSKLMRDDPVDHQDALFICRAGGLDRRSVEAALRSARIPASREVQEDFAQASQRLLAELHA